MRQGNRIAVYGEEVLERVVGMDELVTVTVDLDFTKKESEWLAAYTFLSKDNVWTEELGRDAAALLLRSTISENPRDD